MQKNKKIKGTLKFPSVTDIRTRAGHLNNAFYQTAFKPVLPSVEEEENLYYSIGVEKGECAYCGRKVSKLEADHLHPLVSHEDETTIYRTDITNIVPCCPECNRLKGNKSFIDWYTDNNTRMYLYKCGLTEEQYNDRLKRLSEYSSKSKSLHLDKSIIEEKEFALIVKARFCNLLYKYAITWGSVVLVNNDEHVQSIRDKDALTPEELEQFNQIAKILGVDKDEVVKQIAKKKKEETDNGLW